MYRRTTDHHEHRLGGEGLDLEVSETGTIQCVRDVGAEVVEVEVLRAAADFLVDPEGDASARPRPFGWPPPAAGRLAKTAEPSVSSASSRPASRS